MRKRVCCITGASSGVGLAYARVLACEYHCNLLIISNQEQELKNVAAQIARESGVIVIPLYKDLATPTAAQEIFDFTQQEGLTVEMLINNAGIFYMRYFHSVPMKKIETMMNLHMLTVVKLCRLFGDEMCKRGNGHILNMASMTAWMSMPGIQVYNATKAFVLNFSKSLWYEYQPYGVGVTCLTPGCLDTPLYGLDPKLRRLLVKTGISLTPEDFARRALKATFKRKKQAMPGWCNHLFVPIMNHFPDWAVFFAMPRLKCFKEE